VIRWQPLVPGRKRGVARLRGVECRSSEFNSQTTNWSRSDPQNKHFGQKAVCRDSNGTIGAVRVKEVTQN
jgi:hypothetical protein